MPRSVFIQWTNFKRFRKLKDFAEKFSGSSLNFADSSFVSLPDSMQIHQDNISIELCKQWKWLDYDETELKKKE